MGIVVKKADAVAAGACAVGETGRKKIRKTCQQDTERLSGTKGSTREVITLDISGCGHRGGVAMAIEVIKLDSSPEGSPRGSERQVFSKRGRLGWMRQEVDKNTKSSSEKEMSIVDVAGIRVPRLPDGEKRGVGGVWKAWYGCGK